MRHIVLGTSPEQKNVLGELTKTWFGCGCKKNVLKALVMNVSQICVEAFTDFRFVRLAAIASVANPMLST